MATYSENALWSPYGAYEMKAKYQRNFMYGTGLVLGLVVLGWLGWQVWKLATSEEDIQAVAEVRIKTIAELGPPPTLVKRPPEVKIQNPNVAAPKVGIPKPVADEEVQDEEVQLATRDELAEIVAPDVNASGDQNIVVDISDDEYLPPPDEFVPVEKQPEMILQTQPVYPQIAKSAGLTGTVWVKALVDKDGNVRQAMVGKSSGSAALDDEAVKAAYKNKFTPGVQNGRPVAVWVTYRVDFKLTDS